MGAFYHWIPKMTGRMLSESAGRINFWLLFIGFNLTFFPVHVLGMHGMARRIYQYPVETGWAGLNALATAGALLIAAGGIVFIGNFLWSLGNGRPAGDNPWGADSLEWATSSPPPTYNFVHLPTIEGRYPLWTDTPETPVVTGLRTDRRELLVTRTLDAEPDHRYVIPGNSIWPLITALAVSVGFVASVFVFRYIVIGIVLTAFALAGWFWPCRDPRMGRLEERP
jgi:cytochrome c oxidase subunit 1